MAPAPLEDHREERGRLHQLSPQPDYTTRDSGDRSPPSTFNSPVKQRRKLTADGHTVSETPPDNDSITDTNGFSEKLDAFPTVGQPILDSALKDMLITLHGAFQQDMSNFMRHTNREIAAIGGRVDFIENKMNDCIST